MTFRRNAKFWNDRRPNWTVFLMTDVSIEQDTSGALVVSERGRTQIAAAIKHLRTMISADPVVWLGMPFPMQYFTATELARQLGPETVLRDVSAVVSEDYTSGPVRRRCSFPLSDHEPGQPIVFVSLYEHCRELLLAAGLPVTEEGRAMRSSRAYPIVVDELGWVRRSPLLDAPELQIAVDIPTSEPRD